MSGAHPSRFKKLDGSTGLLVDAFPEYAGGLCPTACIVKQLTACCNAEGSTPQRSETLKAYMRNSAVAVISPDVLLAGGLYGTSVKPYVMPEERSVDINTSFDFRVAEACLAHAAQSSGGYGGC